LLPAPATGSVTTTAGGRIFFVPELDEFTVGDTTQQPGIPEPFHRLISLGMSCDWLSVNGPEERYSKILGQYEQLRAELKEFIGSLNEDAKVRIRPLSDTRNYI
jgi:hypothetical protein